MASTSEVIARWHKSCTDPTVRDLTARICVMDKDSRRTTVYSYGRHFPLAEYWYERRLMLVNGDRWRGPSRTSSHQAEVRRTVEAAVATGWNVDVILLPFSALDAAGIVHDSIRPLEVQHGLADVSR